MTSIAIYVEGGGQSKDGKAELRVGFDGLLAQQKNAARARRMNWKTVLCGSRGEAFAAFHNAMTKQTADVVVLVVDSEEAVADSSPQGRIAHLATRDGWQFSGVSEETVHLMVQCMEAWIVADPEKLDEFFGQGFRRNVLPKRLVLDEEPKDLLIEALKSATKPTKKGSYGKIEHAGKLLGMVRPGRVANRCKSFRLLTEFLDATID